MSISNREPYLYNDDEGTTMAVKDPRYGIGTYSEDEEIKRLTAAGKVIDLSDAPSSLKDVYDEEYASIYQQQMEKEEEMRPTYIDKNGDEQEYESCTNCGEYKVNVTNTCPNCNTY